MDKQTALAGCAGHKISHAVKSAKVPSEAQEKVHGHTPLEQSCVQHLPFASPSQPWLQDVSKQTNPARQTAAQAHVAFLPEV